MMKLNLESIGVIAKGVCKLTAWGVALVALSEVANHGTERNNTNGKYSDAVDAIMKSDMFSSQKQEAVSMLKTDGNEEYYKAIISIANDSRMLTNNKVETIKNLSEK